MREPVLSARDVTVDRGGVRILDGVDLDVFAGDRLLVQGESGAGKTTLFEAFGLLEPPTDGVLRVAGVDATAASERTVAGLRASALGFVFQDFQLIPDLTAFENARVPQEHVADAEVAWLDELFETLGLEAARDQHPATLSGGEKQRVAIARALANRPGIVLADEPTGQLDPKTTDRVLDLLDRVQAKAGSALVVVSHDPRVADRFDDVRRLEAGTLTAPGPEPRVRAPRND